MQASPAGRGVWGSKLGFVLAAAGSAIGLGNIWLFPVVTSQNGGGAFVLVYLLCVFLIGLPVMLAELIIGRKTRSNPVGAFEKLAPGTPWKWLGGLGVLTGLMILSAYCVVAGWILKYIYYCVINIFDGKSPDEISAIFGRHSAASNWLEIVLFMFLFMALTVVIVVRGISGGIEKATKFLMPVLLVLLVFLCFRAITLEGGGAGLSFYLNPDFSKLSFSVFLAALGQAFFSLSLGMGAMITYGSYLQKRDNLASSALWVCSMDSGIAILAGFAIFPALFAAGLDHTQSSAGLLFQVLPNLFNSIPAGQLFGTLFFFLVGIAALTSTISLLEVVVSYFIDEKGWTRAKAATVLGAVAAVVGIPSAVSGTFMGGVFTYFGSLSLVIGALALCLFVAYQWGLHQALEHVRIGNPSFPAAGIWSILVKWVCPLAIIAILVNGYILPLFQ